MRGKTIMSDNCDVANCADTSATMAEKGEIMKRRRTHCVAEALNDVSYKNNTHSQNIRVSIVDIEEILPAQSRRPGGAMPRPLRRQLLRTHTTYQIRGGWPMNSAKKKAYQGACSHTGHDRSIVSR